MTSETGSLARKTLRTSYISTVISISLVLFMIGTLGVLVIHARSISNYVKENIQLTVYLLQDTRAEDSAVLIQQLDKSPYVRSTRFVTRDEAAEQLKAELGEDFIGFLGYNPLHPSIDVRLRAEFADVEKVNELKTLVSSNPIVKEVDYQESQIDMINKNMRTLGIVILGFSALLFLISAALINNTIRLALYSKRLLIKSMLLVGATRKFIRKPFLATGLLQGLFGGIAANILLLILLWFSRQQIPDLVQIQDIQMIGVLMGGVIAAGMILSFASTFFAVNKYLRSNTQDLY